MKALVTGATGFVGSHLVTALRRDGHEVVALVRTPAKAARLKGMGATLVPGDLGDDQAVAAAVTGADIVFHVAGLTAARSEAEFHQVNVEATGRLLEAAARAGVGRFVLVSSLAATAPVTAYGRSKAEAERVVQQGSVPWTIARPPAVYGPRDVELLKVFRLARLPVVPIFGDGSQQLSLVYGPDLATALIAMAMDPRSAGQVHHPAHPEIISSAGLVHAIAGAMGRTVRLLPLPRPVATGILTLTGTAARLAGRATLLNRDKANEFFHPAWTCDPASLEEATGWRAEHDLTTGLARTYSWYREYRWL